MTLAIDVQGLNKTFGTRRVVKDVHVRVDCGEVVGLLGPNGAGKTTTIEIILGLREATEGTVSVFGVDTVRQHAAARSLLGIQLQESDFFDHLTLAEQLRYLGSCYGARPDAGALLAAVLLASVSLSGLALAQNTPTNATTGATTNASALINVLRSL